MVVQDLHKIHQMNGKPENTSRLFKKESGSNGIPYRKDLLC